MEIYKCPICKDFFNEKRCLPLNLQCGHVICQNCLISPICPIDGINNFQNPKSIPVNTALLILLGVCDNFPIKDIDSYLTEKSTSTSQTLKDCFTLVQIIAKSFCNYLSNNDDAKSKNNSITISQDSNKNGNKKSIIISRSLQKKILNLVIIPLSTDDCRWKAIKVAKNIIERICHDITHSIQIIYGSSIITSNLWNAVRSRGCQFLGPKLQSAILKQIIATLGDGSALSRKTLVLYIVRQIESEFPTASKTSVGHVVQLLYRASCFKVTKREDDSSLMQLHDKYFSFEELRKAHDIQMVQIASEIGLRISPDHWSYILYGDDLHKSYMQSIIDKVQPPYSLSQSIQELYNSLSKIGDPLNMRMSLTGHFSEIQKVDVDELKKTNSISMKILHQTLLSSTSICHTYSKFLTAIENNLLPTEEFKSLREKAKSKKVCYFYNTFGLCMKSSSCPYSHDPTFIKQNSLKLPLDELPNKIPTPEHSINLNFLSKSPLSDTFDKYSSSFNVILQAEDNHTNSSFNNKNTLNTFVSHSCQDGDEFPISRAEYYSKNAYNQTYSIKMKENARNTHKNLNTSIGGVGGGGGGGGGSGTHNVRGLSPSFSSYVSSNENSFKDYYNQNFNSFDTPSQLNNSLNSYSNLSASVGNIVNPPNNSFSSSFDRISLNDSMKSKQFRETSRNHSSFNFNENTSSILTNKTFSGNLIANQLKLQNSREEYVNSLEKNSLLDSMNYEVVVDNNNSDHCETSRNTNTFVNSKENNFTKDQTNSYLEQYLGVDINSMFDEML